MLLQARVMRLAVDRECYRAQICLYSARCACIMVAAQCVSVPPPYIQESISDMLHFSTE